MTVKELKDKLAILTMAGYGNKEINVVIPIADPRVKGVNLCTVHNVLFDNEKIFLDYMAEVY